MSRAFVNEDRLADSAPLAERPVSPHPNYVTERGLAQLQARHAALQEERKRLLVAGDGVDRQRLAEVERDLRYYAARLKSAIPTPPPAAAPERVIFGCRVTVLDEDDGEQVYMLVGEDEADAARGLVSWVSPLGQALLGREPGETVTWRRPAGDRILEILDIGPPQAD